MGTIKTTAYNQVAEVLRTRILRNELLPGEQLPTEQALCREFGTSRITIRRAMQILEEELLVRRRQGSGTFVSAKPARKIPVWSAQFSASLARHAPELQRHLDRGEWRPADEEIASQLNTVVGDRVLFLRRIDSMGRLPVSMDEVYLLHAYADRLAPQDWGRLDFIDRWQAVQRITVAHSVQAVEAVGAGKVTARILKVKPHVPLLKETEVVHLTTGRVAAVFTSYYRHDYFRLIGTVRYADDRRQL